MTPTIRPSKATSTTANSHDPTWRHHFITLFPFAGGGGGAKVRPAVVVQCDRLNRQIETTLIALITGNVRLVGREPTQFLIDPATTEGASAGLLRPSAVKCENLFTARQDEIVKTIGHLSPSLFQQLDACLKSALELP